MFTYSQAGQRAQALVIQKMLSPKGSYKDTISFAAGLPDPSLFPVNELRKSLIRQSRSALHYQYALPSQRLKIHIQRLMAKRGIKCGLEQILITTGAQQGISLLVRLFLNSSQEILVDPFVYPGYKNIIESYNPKLIPLSLTHNGSIDFSKISKHCDSGKHLPYLYTIANGHNPLGISMDIAQRKELALIAHKYNFPLIEDDPYGWISYENKESPPLLIYNKSAIYIGSFSKIISPSLRVGWIVASEDVVEKLGYIKDQIDINMANFSQHVIADYLDNNCLHTHLIHLKNAYKHKRDLAVQTILKYFPSCVSLIPPKHGFFIWIKFNCDLDLTKLQNFISHHYQIVYIPGSAFSIDPSHGRNMMRLSFSLLDENILVNGLKKLGLCLQDILNKKIMIK